MIFSPMYSFLGRYKKFLTVFTLSILLFSTVLSLFAPQKAYALLGVGDTTANVDVTPPGTPNQQEAIHVTNKVETSIWNSMWAASLSAVTQAVSYYMNKVAYETAVYIASGNKGQDSLIEKKGWGAFLEDTALDAAGAAIDDLGQTLGFNLCRFPNLNLQLYLELNLRRMAAPTTNCTWNDFKDTLKSYKNLYNDVTTGVADFAGANGQARGAAVDRAIARKFVNSIRTNNTDFGVAVGGILEVDRLKVQREKAATNERITNKGFKDLTNIISGNVKTPGDVIGEETKKTLSANGKQQMTFDQINGIYASGALQILPSTAAMFLNTLIHTTIDRYLPSLPDEGSYVDPSIAYSDDASTIYLDRIAAAKAAFGYLQALPPLQTNNYPLLAEMASCPDVPGSNNCVMDSGLQAALSLSETNQALTIREALEKDYLKGNWRLISPRRPLEQEDVEGCLTDKYCYSNIQKLRKARILPLGFEIAALRSDPDNPWTLQQVVDGFDDCKPGEGSPTSTVPDPAHPFCHLINPNWILKIPKYRCDAQVFSDNLTYSGSAERKQECADLATCLAFDENNNCLDWGYCTKEKNIWDINVDHCPAYYNTCTTFVNTENSQLVNYLAKTVDYAECSAENTGCRAYSLNAVLDRGTGEFGWTTSLSTDVNKKISGDTQVAYFNHKIKDLSNVCSVSNDGCSAFWQAQILPDGRYIDQDSSSTQIEYGIDRTREYSYLKKAPDYLGCYDRDLVAPGVQWPTTILEASTALARSESCNNFASACVAEEVGCEAFIPMTKDSDGNSVEDGPTVPGKIGAENFCSSECVGYQTFKQEPSPFDPAKFPVYFIDSQAEQCTAEVAGCSEFTNIDAQSRGGEGREYYTDLKYCEKPNGDPVHPNIDTFYSWEGSQNSGYNILTHRLKPLTAVDTAAIAAENAALAASFPEGSPAYILDTPEALVEFVNKCNENSYNILLNSGPLAVGAADNDCRAMFDDEGRTFYRLLSKTVVVDPTCHPLRKTDPVFEKDTRVVNRNQNTCEQNKGRWNPNNGGFCERCINGGSFENGFCIYHTVSSAPNSCQGPAEEPDKFNGCRAYTGNAVGNIQDIIPLDDFEPIDESAEAYAEALIPWKKINNAAANLRVVKEAIYNGKHSLQVDQAMNVGRDLVTSTLETSQWYELSFFAKSLGVSSSVQIAFKQGNAPVGTFALQNKPLSIGGGWQLYKLGPIQFTGNSNIPVTLSFERAQNNNQVYFLDQIRLRKVIEMKYYIKDSWKEKNNGLSVPLTCDSLPEDNLPGEALGCTEYKDSNSISRYATGFERLCREGAMGCQPLWDTYNTLEGGGAAQSQVFNSLCFGLANETCKVIYNQEELGNCFVPRGQSSCHVPRVIIPEGLNWIQFKAAMQAANAGQLKVDIDTSSVITLADTPEVSPLFLASGEKQKFVCDKGALGCQKVGLEQKYLPTSTVFAYQFSEVFIKNDPDKYIDTLCRNDLVGCTKYRDGAKETYFKDPTITGNSLCTYKEKQENQDGTYGWFLDGVGRCNNNDESICRTDSDCGVNAKCLDVDVPCADDHLVSGGLYDIWSNETVGKYDGNVGVCEAQYNQCREIVDRQDTSNLNPDGKPYYLIFNSKVDNKQKECTEVSLTEGCVLFDKTDEPNKLYDSAATYIRSEKKLNQPFGLVPPVVSSDGGEFTKADSNMILKVDRDRECSEWLACQSSTRVKKQDGTYDYVCEKLVACEKLGTNAGECGKTVDSIENRLTYERYITRDISWFDEERSGYSLYNRYQIGDLIYVYFKVSKELEDALPNETFTHSYLARTVPDKLFIENEGLSLDCHDETVTSTDWDICGFDDGGRCYNEYCLYPVDGLFTDKEKVDKNASLSDQAEKISAIVDRLESNQCKGTPEQASPFSRDILEKSDMKYIYEDYKSRNLSTDRKSGFEGSNFCQYGDCSCSYQKVTYKNAQVDYWPLDFSDTLTGGYTFSEGICSGGPFDGFPCRPDDRDWCDEKEGDQIVQNFECVPVGSVDKFVGYDGYCLEYDFSRPNKYNGKYPCLTWLPVQASVSPIDIYATAQDAGYNPAIDASVDANDPAVGGIAYCTQSYVEKGAADESVIDRAFMRSFSEDTAEDRTYPPFGAGRCSNDIDGDFEYNSKFHGAFCSDYYANGNTVNTPENPLSPLEFLQNWGRSANGLNDPTAKVLRIETAHTQTDYLQGYYSSIGPFTNAEVLNCGKQGHPQCTVYGLAPLYGHNDDGFVELGAMMHPPRLFEKTPAQLLADKCALGWGWTKCDQEDQGYFEGYALSCDGSATEGPQPEAILNPDGSSSYAPSTQEFLNCLEGGRQSPEDENDHHDADPSFVYTSSVGRKIAPLAYSPEFLSRTDVDGYESAGSIYNSSGNTNLYISGESEMRLDNLKRVYFVPTGYPGGIEGNLPALMNKKMYIDFSLLDRDDVILEHREIPDAFNGDNNDNDDDDSANDPDIFFGPAAGINGHLYTYVLKGPEEIAMDNPELTNNEGLLSYDKLPDDLKGRNAVAKRYVMLYKTDAEEQEEEHVGASVTKDPDTGELIFAGGPPLTGDSCQDRSYAWFAVAMDFNAEGEFLGYVSRWCMGYDPADDGQWQDYGIQFAVLATYNDRCTEVNKIYDTTREGFSLMRKDSNKAWTNRVWRFADNTAPSGSGADYGGLNRDTEEMPFGSLSLSNGKLDLKGSYIYSFMYSFRHIVPNTGVPFSCESGNCDHLNFPADRDDRVKMPRLNFINGKTLPQARSFLHQLFAKEYLRVELLPVSGDIPDEREREVICLANASNNDNTFNLLSECPSVEVQQAEYSYSFTDGRGDQYYGFRCDGTITAEERRIGDAFTRCMHSPNIVYPKEVDYGYVQTKEVDVAGTEKLLIPQVYSIEPYHCLTDRSKPCTAYEANSFTIGERNGSLGDYDGDGLDDEDRNGDGNPDPLIILGDIYYAKMRFFAFADDNRMPIRRVKTDWGDNSGLDQLDKRGLYENRKPVCELSNGSDGDLEPTLGVCMATSTVAGILRQTPTGMPCLNAADAEGRTPISCPTNQYCWPLDNTKADISSEYAYKLFGNLPRACEDTYFEYSHQYTCSSAEIETYRRLGTEQDGGNGPIMKVTNPRLAQYRDELARYPGTDYVCAFKPKLQVMDNWGWCNGSCTKSYINGIPQSSPQDRSVGCYNEWPIGVDDLTTEQCDEPGSDPKLNPWTEYKQYIIMIPG